MNLGEILLIAILVLGGMALILLEITTPFFGTMMAASLLCFGYAVYRCFAINTTLGFAIVLALLIGIPIYVVLLIRHFPKTRLGKRLTLGEKPAATGAQATTEPDPATLVGQEGQALSILRPSGTVQIGQRRLTARAESGFIPAGTAVKVVSANAFSVVVRSIDGPDDTASNTAPTGQRG